MSSHPIDGTSATSIPSLGDGASRTSAALFSRLTLMMLLEFVVFGSWFATFGLVLATHKLPTIIGTAYSLAAVAAIISPMFLGALGDRFMASQKVLGLAHLIGGALMLFVPSAVQRGDGGLVLLLIFGYMLFFQPTLGLTNSIAFRHIGPNQNLFPYIRVFGTLGWVIAGLGVGALGFSASTNMFMVTAIASLVLGVYSFTLPATPPPARGVRFSLGDVIGVKTFALFRHRNFVLFSVCVLLTAISLGVYNSFASPYLGALGIKNVAGVLAIGQASEVLFIVTIPWVLARLGMKWALLAGMCMWGVRFTLFALAANGHVSLAILGVALHGICSDFFVVLGAMYLGRVTPLELAAQAQGWLILLISGVGAFIGSFVSGQIFSATVAAHPTAGPSAWTPMWILPIASAIVTAVLWTAFFRYSRQQDLTRFEVAPNPGMAA